MEKSESSNAVIFGSIGGAQALSRECELPARARRNAKAMQAGRIRDATPALLRDATPALLRDAMRDHVVLTAYEMYCFVESN